MASTLLPLPGTGRMAHNWLVFRPLAPSPSHCHAVSLRSHRAHRAAARHRLPVLPLDLVQRPLPVALVPDSWFHLFADDLALVYCRRALVRRPVDVLARGRTHSRSRDRRLTRESSPPPARRSLTDADTRRSILPRARQRNERRSR